MNLGRSIKHLLIAMAALLVEWLVEQRAMVATFVFCILPILILVVRRSRVVRKKPKFPPSPFKLPIIGNIHQLGKLPHRSLRDLSRKHGPLMLLHLGRTPALVVSSAKAAQEVYKANELDFANRPSMSSANNLFYGTPDMGFAPYGEYWRQLRKICMTHLLNTKRVQSFGFVREEEVDLLIENISRACNPSVLINLSDMITSLVHDMICRIALGSKYSEPRGTEQSKLRFSDLAQEFMKLLAGVHVGDLFPSLSWIDVLNGKVSSEKKFAQEMNGFLEHVIEDHLDPKRRETEHRDLVDVLLQLTKDTTLNFPVTKETIKVIILDMFVGASDTTSISLEWAMTELAKNPRVMKKAQEEVRRVAGGKLKVEESDLHEMEFLKCTVKESLRLHPAAPVLPPRESINEVEILGYTVPAKSVILTNAWAIGRDPELWDRAEEFLPERFINSPVDFKGHDFQFIPFGAGRRGCPGGSFAVPIIELAVANLLLKFNWELPKGMKPEDIDMSEELGMAVRKATPLLLLATPHLS